MDANYPAISMYSNDNTVPSVSAASTDPATNRKLIDYLRAETTRLIIAESQKTQTTGTRAHEKGIAMLLCTARANVSRSIRMSLERSGDKDEYDVEKTVRLEAELPSAFIALDEDFRRWTESVSCAVRWDVEMVNA